MRKDLFRKLNSGYYAWFFDDQFSLTLCRSRYGRKRGVIAVALVFGDCIFYKIIYNLLIQNFNLNPKIAFLELFLSLNSQFCYKKSTSNLFHGNGNPESAVFCGQ